jgi:type II secretory pathway pseudopilin PulG
MNQTDIRRVLGSMHARVVDRPVVAAIAAAVVIALVAAAIGWVYNYGNAQAWEARALAAEEQAAQKAVALDQATAELEQTRTELDRTSEDLIAMRSAKAQLATELAGYTSRESEIAKLESQLQKQARDLESREAAVSKTERQVESNTIYGGTWTVGVDVKPGTYRTKEQVSSGYCYWEITTTGSNGRDIIANDIVQGGRPVVTLREGQDFTTQDCGSWIKE